MTRGTRYILDSDIFITAKNAYYAFDICPGFWDALLRLHEQERVYSISRVRDELRMGRKAEDLYQWVSREVPDGFFLDVDEQAITDAYASIMLWAQRHGQYTDAAKAKFATGADGWLVAYGKVHGMVVVTNEQPAPASRNEIKIPDVCNQFGVKPINTFELLRKLGVRLNDEEAP